MKQNEKKIHLKLYGLRYFLKIGEYLKKGKPLLEMEIDERMMRLILK